MNVEHFVRQLKLTAEQQGQLAFFVGAGCSVSSGIPGADALVKEWLPKLHYQMTGEGEPFDEWVARELPRYKQEDPAASYASVMRRLFPQSPQRQREVERFALGKDPAFGYAVLASLITHKDFAPCFKLVLTTNFDDLVADALYLFTQQKPLVVAHESLAGFVETGRTRPLVIKLHGDALLEPKSLEEETAELDPAIQEVLTEQLRDRGLVFVGYGGNDRSISGFLKGLPANTLKWGVYWVNKQLPEADFGEWLEWGIHLTQVATRCCGRAKASTKKRIPRLLLWRGVGLRSASDSRSCRPKAATAMNSRVGRLGGHSHDARNLTFLFRSREATTHRVYLNEVDTPLGWNPGPTPTGSSISASTN